MPLSYSLCFLKKKMIEEFQKQRMQLGGWSSRFSIGNSGRLSVCFLWNPHGILLISKAAAEFLSVLRKRVCETYLVLSESERDVGCRMRGPQAVSCWQAPKPFMESLIAPFGGRHPPGLMTWFITTNPSPPCPTAGLSYFYFILWAASVKSWLRLP